MYNFYGIFLIITHAGHMNKEKRLSKIKETLPKTAVS